MQREGFAALKHPKGAKKSDSQIAMHVGVSHVTVGKYRSQLEATCKVDKSTEREGRDGRTTNTANIGKDEESKVETLASKGLPVREIAEKVGWSKSKVARHVAETKSESGTKREENGTVPKQKESTALTQLKRWWK